MQLSRALAAPLLVALLLTSGCGLYQEFPSNHVTPWPIVQVEGDGHERPRVLVTRRILESDGGGQRLDVVHEEVVDSGLFSAVQTRATQGQTRPGYDYVLHFSLTSRDDYGWYSWLGLIPGFPLMSKEIYTLTCTVYDGEEEQLGEVTRDATVDQALGLLLLPFNIVYTILPGRFSPYDFLSTDWRESLMIRALTRDVLMLANERFDFRPKGLLTDEELQKKKERTSLEFAQKGLDHMQVGELEAAEQDLAQALKANPNNSNAWYNLSCTYARMGKLDQAMETLDAALRTGYRDAAHMRRDEDLDPLRERADFKRLLEGLEAKKESSKDAQSSQEDEAKKPAEWPTVPEDPAHPEGR